MLGEHCKSFARGDESGLAGGQGMWMEIKAWKRGSVEIVYRTPQMMGQKRRSGQVWLQVLSPCDWKNGDVAQRVAIRRQSWGWEEGSMEREGKIFMWKLLTFRCRWIWPSQESPWESALPAPSLTHPALSLPSTLSIWSFSLLSTTWLSPWCRLYHLSSEFHMHLTLSLCVSIWPQCTQIFGPTLSWVCLWWCFSTRLTFESVYWSKQIVFSNVGGSHPISWRSKQNKRPTLLTISEKKQELLLPGCFELRLWIWPADLKWPLAFLGSWLYRFLDWNLLHWLSWFSILQTQTETICQLSWVSKVPTAHPGTSQPP